MSNRKSGSPRKRMREVIHRGPKHPPVSSKAIDAIFPDASPELRERLWVNEAKSALSVEDMTEVRFGGEVVKLPPDWIDYQARAIRRLFDHFKLDPNQPSHWRWLVTMFAYAEFWEGPRRKRGRPVEWTDAREAELAAAIETLPGRSISTIARRLANDKKSPFVGKGVVVASGRSLRSRIAKVKKRSPKSGA